MSTAFDGSVEKLISRPLRIIMPLCLIFILFAMGVFLIVIPSLKKHMLDQKRQMIRLLNDSSVSLTCSLLSEYSRRVNSGELTLEQAQARAKKRIGSLRYGPENNHYFWIAEKIHNLDMLRFEKLRELNRMAGASVEELTTFALSEAIELTLSSIGYLVLLNDDESCVSLYTWYKGENCLITDKERILAHKGMWKDAVEHRKALIINEYKTDTYNTINSRWPGGHGNIIRYMHVPVFDGEKIVAVAGVGNKDVVGKTSSLDALDTFKSEPHGFDLVLVDLAISGMNGLELCKRILDLRSDIPIVVCRGFSDGLLMDKDLEKLGIFATVMKPMIASELAQVVHEALNPDSIHTDDKNHKGWDHKKGKNCG